MELPLCPMSRLWQKGIALIINVFPPNRTIVRDYICFVDLEKGRL